MSEFGLHICGSELCIDGKPHDNDGPWVDIKNGGSVSCSRCGSLAIDRFLMSDAAHAIDNDARTGKESGATE